MTQFNVTDEIISQINSILTQPPEDASTIADKNMLLHVCQIVGKASNIHIIPPLRFLEGTIEQQLKAITASSQIRYRKVQLDGEWWKQDCGPLVLIRQGDHQPHALIPAQGTYLILNAETTEPIHITADLAATFEETGYLFYRPLPEKPLHGKSMFQFLKHGLAIDLKQILWLQIFLSLMALFTPVAMGILLSEAVPNADKNMLLQIGSIFIVSSVVMLLCKYSQSYALIRVRFKLNISLQAATMDRLLKLPVRFFQGYDAGDLALRVEGIDAIQHEVSNTILVSLFGLVYVILSFILMLFYSPLLALVALFLALINIAINFLVIVFQLKYVRESAAVNGRFTSLVLQILRNIIKVRATNAEAEIFKMLSSTLIKKSTLIFKYYQFNNQLQVFNLIYYPFVTVVLFALVGYVTQLTFGNFITFSAAFSQFFVSLVAIGNALNNLLKIIPLYERATAVLSAEVENKADRVKNFNLSGKIKFEDVFFRYDKSTPFVLKNISLDFVPGEKIAFVGPSGSGKSTLFKLLLGFESPELGKIFFDDIELVKLDLIELRRQFGVVLQNNFLLSGTVFETITAQSGAGLEEAWRASELALLAKDIQAMPMGMDTIIGEGGKNLSAGQRQRLLIARSVINKPQILLLDEATSALDNVTQAAIQHNLSQLNITQIIAAHRLSTIKNADTIYVLDQGTIVQKGNYTSLLTDPGLFAQLASRQFSTPKF